MLLPAACGNSDTASTDDIAECGRIHFPARHTVVADNREDMFGGDRIVEIIVDLAASDLTDFKSKSSLGSFATGVPAYSRKHYWKGMPESSVLQNDAGNEYFEESDGSRERAVAIHQLDPEHIRIFARANC
ncbi:hypothetical protein ACFWUP_23675 [Nocardia sp. NPDC058658]|uniref:hypothetical protein n=1 Tax=Nocardia sp. NPDC058658 TaxID=3346580 RepID=UPI00365F5952